MKRTSQNKASEWRRRRKLCVGKLFRSNLHGRMNREKYYWFAERIHCSEANIIFEARTNYNQIKQCEQSVIYSSFSFFFIAAFFCVCKKKEKDFFGEWKWWWLKALGRMKKFDWWARKGSIGIRNTICLRVERQKRCEKDIKRQVLLNDFFLPFHPRPLAASPFASFEW